MSESINLETGHVLFTDLPKNSKEDTAAVEIVIRAAIEFYNSVYGNARRVWVHPKDISSELTQIDGYKIEQRGGCPRGKIMVM